ncbi:hypothetical protein G788_00863 [Escherichia coli HVH 128 (4-7030436)]|nr:hypothetical protein G788_00863 [Escherichia coli HVH 128 (4-7030436)]
MPVSRNRCIFLNVGLGEGSALPVGVGVPWLSAMSSSGWVSCWGALFSGSVYPWVGIGFPGLHLPVLGGVFFRVWFAGRGVVFVVLVVCFGGGSMFGATHWMPGWFVAPFISGVVCCSFFSVFWLWLSICACGFLYLFTDLSVFMFDSVRVVRTNVLISGACFCGPLSIAFH